jgi:hypothetical protein
MVARISMDLVVDPKDSPSRRGLANPRNREAMTEACVEVLRRLGKLAAAVEAFRVMFSKNGGGNWEADVTTHFSNPMGVKCSDGMTYEFKPNEQTDFRVIASRICRDDLLERRIREHVERGRALHQRSTQAFAEFD